MLLYVIYLFSKVDVKSLDSCGNQPHIELEIDTLSQMRSSHRCRENAEVCIEVCLISAPRSHLQNHGVFIGFYPKSIFSSYKMSMLFSNLSPLKKKKAMSVLFLLIPIKIMDEHVSSACRAWGIGWASSAASPRSLAPSLRPPADCAAGRGAAWDRPDGGLSR